MPDKGLSVVTYAAGASLATIALVYVFAPTYFIDSGPSSSSNPLSSLTSRKTGVVGLINVANDCFINSVLQALAGLADLRIYLIRETHRRTIDDAGVYSHAVLDDAETTASDSEGANSGPARHTTPLWKIEGQQAGLATKGLKDMIDQLNERPIHKKVISARPFVHVLEVAFRQRISRQQQDAQEFLQVVAERLGDEYHAGRRARRYARRQAAAAVSAGGLDVAATTGADVARSNAVAAVTLNSHAVDEKLASIAAAGSANGTSTGENGHAKSGQAKAEKEDEDEDEDGFPMEGKIESQIECLTCHFKPRPSGQTFCTLTLNVPQESSTTLSACFDTMLQTEYIDEFKCEKCRLVHAQQIFETELAKAKSESDKKAAQDAIAALQRAIDTDPEQPPADVTLPDVRYAPKRRIARHFRLVRFPKVLAIHLSRSIFDASNTSHKNSAKVAFPERLPLGGILHQRKYKLISVVTHKGSHHSGHYESFRRQTVAAPYSNPNTFRPSPAFTPSSTPPATTPRIGSSDVAPGAAASSSSLAINGSSSGHPGPPPPATELPLPAVTTTSMDPPSPLGPKTNMALDRTSSLRGRSSPSTARPPAPTSAPREPTATATRDEEDGGSGSSPDNADATAETSSLRSITRSTLSRITSSSRSGSHNGRRSLSLRPASKDGAAGAAPEKSAANGGGDSTAVSIKAKTAAVAPPPRQRKKKTPDRWWRISDEKVREASTREVLGMQREVYLLFYEMERDR